MAIDPTQHVPPHSTDAELAVIAGLLIDPNQCHDVIPRLSVDDFYHQHHQAVYAAIQALYERQEPLDIASILTEIQKQGLIRSKRVDVEIYALLRDAAHRVPHALNTLKHAHVIRQHRIRRQLLHTAHELSHQALDFTLDPHDILSRTSDTINHFQEDPRDITSAPSLLTELNQRIKDRQVAGGRNDGVVSGFHDLDSLIGAFGSESLNIIAARPSMGKTAFALNIARSIAQQRPVLFISLEMSKLELVERLLVTLSQVDNRKIRGLEYLDVRDLAKILIAQEEIHQLPILIDDTAIQTITRIQAVARQYQRQHHIGAIIIDYLQLLDADGKHRDTRQEQIAKMSRQLKTLAKDLRIPIFALSQLNRAAEQREDRRPRMSDLRESGAIEQDADSVLLIHRPEYYDPNDQPGIAEIIVAKNRHGPTGTIQLRFIRQLACFHDHVIIPSPNPSP